MYKQKSYDLGDVIEVMEYHDGRYGAPGMKRLKKKKATPEQIEKINKINKERKCWRKMVLNFRENDYWITLTYKKDERPLDMKAAAQDIKDFIDKIRSQYRKREKELKWMLHTEIGSKGGCHHHLVLNRITDADLIIKKAWSKGGIHLKLMYEEGNFQKLAEYLSKKPDEENKLKESRYSCSRNLKLPKSDTKPYKRKTWTEEPKPRKGFYVDKQSYHEGINPVTGYKYRRYLMMKVQLNRRI
jgi:hypothetical protein